MSFENRLIPYLNSVAAHSSRDSLLSPPVGRYAETARIGAAPAVLVLALGLTPSQSLELGRILLASQRLTGGFRPVLVVDDVALRSLAGFGWAMEHIPSEMRWEPCSGPRTWEDLVRSRCQEVIEWYGISVVTKASAEGAFSALLGSLSALTTTNVLRAVAVREDEGPEFVAGTASWVSRGGITRRTLIKPNSEETDIAVEIRSGAGVLVARGGQGPGLSFAVEVAKAANWSLLHLISGDLNPQQVLRFVDAIEHEVDRPQVVFDPTNDLPLGFEGHEEGGLERWVTGIPAWGFDAQMLARSLTTAAAARIRAA